MDDAVTEMLGRMATLEFALGAVLRHLPDEARREVQRELGLFVERSDATHVSGRAVAEAARSILKESGVQRA